MCDAYRERVCWSTGDGSHGVHMVYAAWGDTPLSDQFLRLAPFSDRGDGMLQMAYPPENPGRYVHPQFLLQWPTRVREHYLFTGRRAVLEELYPSVRRQIDWYAPHLDADGLLRDSSAQERNRVDAQRLPRRQLPYQRAVRRGPGGRRLAGRPRG